MGLLSKLHLKKKDKDKAGKEDGHKKHKHAHSQDAVRPQHDTTKRQAPQLIVAEAPNRPAFGGKGLQGDTTYDIQRQHDHDKRDHKDARQPHDKPAHSAPAHKPEPIPQPSAPGDPSNDPGKQQQKPQQSQFSAADIVSGDKAAGPGGNTGTTAPGEAEHHPILPKIPDYPGIVIHVAEIFEMGLFLALLGFALFIKWLHPSVLGLLIGTALGAGLGLAGGFVFFYNTSYKQLLNDGLNITPGHKGLTKLLGGVPSWVTFQDKEKVEWLNTIVNEAWPMYDRAVCQMVKETVEPIMDQYKPPGLVKSIYFKTLTFGEAPIRLNDVWVEDEGDNHVLLEVGFRWAGDANIAICVELMGGAARMVPRVSNLSVAGTFRIILSPLVPTIPCFGAAVISLRKPPLIHFSLDFAGAGASAVKMWLDPFLRDTLASLLVWPNRIVVPMLPENQTGSLDHLKLRHVGLLVVEVVEAKDLHKQDVFGKADPLVELWTQSTHKEQTKHVKHTLTPHWNDTKYCLVQEPKTQSLHVELADHDAINLKDMAKSLNVVKSFKDSMGKHSFMARSSVPIRQYYDRPSESVDSWHELGKNEWYDDEGTGEGCGQLRLKITYWPFDKLYSEPRHAKTGAVLVTLKSATNIPAADPNGLSDPYVVFTLQKETKQSAVQLRTLTPAWEEKHDWTRVPVKETLKVELWDEDKFNGDDKLGFVEIDIESEIASSKNGTAYKRWFLQDVPPDEKTKEVYDAEITMEIQWVPYDFEDAKQ